MVFVLFDVLTVLTWLPQSSLFPEKNSISLTKKYKMSDLVAASSTNLKPPFPLVYYEKNVFSKLPFFMEEKLR